MPRRFVRGMPCRDVVLSPLLGVGLAGGIDSIWVGQKNKKPHDGKGLSRASLRGRRGAGSSPGAGFGGLRDACASWRGAIAAVSFVGTGGVGLYDLQAFYGWQKRGTPTPGFFCASLLTFSALLLPPLSRVYCNTHPVVTPPSSPPPLRRRPPRMRRTPRPPSCRLWRGAARTS
jgi:hypothetical protein